MGRRKQQQTTLFHLFDKGEKTNKPRTPRSICIKSKTQITYISPFLYSSTEKKTLVLCHLCRTVPRSHPLCLYWNHRGRVWFSLPVPLNCECHSSSRMPRESRCGGLLNAHIHNLPQEKMFVVNNQTFTFSVYV